MGMLILASNSPRRKELLSLTGLKFAAFPVDVDETPLPGEEPAACVLRLANDKAQAALQRTSQQYPGMLILASDTIVTHDHQIYGKPTNPADARSMLLELRNRTHTVLTAIALAQSGSGDLLTDLCGTEVPMRDYSDQEMDDYIATGDPLDKAGAYAIQHIEFHPVSHLTGCYASVMGLPLCHLTRALAKFHIAPYADVPAACQSALQYRCTVYPSILKAGPDLQEN